MQKTSPSTRAALTAFGEAIRQERKARSLSQEKLAELADVHMTYIGKVERAEKNISFENILNIARALGMQPSALWQKAGL